MAALRPAHRGVLFVFGAHELSCALRMVPRCPITIVACRNVCLFRLCRALTRRSFQWVPIRTDDLAPAVDTYVIPALRLPPGAWITFIPSNAVSLVIRILPTPALLLVVWLTVAP